jgi:hypothetical protein
MTWEIAVGTAGIEAAETWDKLAGTGARARPPFSTPQGGCTTLTYSGVNSTAVLRSTGSPVRSTQVVRRCH